MVLFCCSHWLYKKQLANIFLITFPVSGKHKRFLSFAFNFLITFIYLCVCWGKGKCVPQCEFGGYKTTSRSWFSPFTMLAQEIKLMSSGLEARTFICSLSLQPDCVFNQFLFIYHLVCFLSIHLKCYVSYSPSRPVASLLGWETAGINESSDGEC